MKEKTTQEIAKDLIRQCHNDKSITIGEVDYKILKSSHKTRKKIFAFYSSIEEQLKNNKYAFLGTDEWDLMEEEILNVISVNDTKLSIKKDHFDEENHSKDFITVMITAMQVLSYPFIRE